MGALSYTARNIIIGGSILLATLQCRAQFYDHGQDPASLKWEQIRSEHFRLVFPADFGGEARRMAHILETYYEPNSTFLNHRPSSIPVVLHNHSVLSNGFVAWAPKRMELVTTPAAGSYSHDHLEQLALHEFRHVVQVDKLRQGFTKGLSWAIGEAGTGLVAGILPFWYLEGDATDAETRLSLAGRGRLPSFEMELKAILAGEDQMFPYEKAVYGSYKDYVPNHYKTGYQMVAHGRNKYGNQLWENVVNYAGRKPFTIYPNYFSLKKYTGLSKTGLYRETFTALSDHWEKSTASRELTDFRKVNRKGKKHYTSYYFPAWINDSVIFSRKSGIDQINEFVAIDRSGKEKRIHRPGFSDAVRISVAANRIVWTEVRYDPRWERRSYSMIKLWDINAGQEKIIGLKGRYFAPDLSSDGNFIACVESDVQNRYYLVILHANTGDVISRIPSPGNGYLQYPTWNDDRSRIYMTSLSGMSKEIVYYELRPGEWGTVFHAGAVDIAELDCKGDFLVFRGAFSGIDNIHAMDLKTSEIQQVTSARFGAFSPCLSANTDTLLYADYTSQGYDVVKTAFDPTEFTPLEDVKTDSEQLNIPSEEEVLNVPVPGNPEQDSYESTPYRKIGNLFSFHSWAPLYADLDDPSIEDLEVSPGLMLVSQNLLSTATTVLGYEYKLEDRKNYLHASFTWSGWYPKMKFSLDYGGSPLIGRPDTIPLPSEIARDLKMRTRIWLPLNLTYSRFVTGLWPSVEAAYSRTILYSAGQEAYKKGLTSMHYRLYFNSYLKKSKRDILPRFGGVMDLRYRNYPYSQVVGTQSLISGTAYLPGILRHQTLKIYAGKQIQKTVNYLIPGMMTMPRSLHYYSADELSKVSFEYVFPIAYPDWQIWRAAYFKRFRGMVFYDYAEGKNVYIPNSRPVSKSFESLGIGLSTDVHLAQIFVPFNIGGRLIYVPETGSTAGEFVFSVDLSQF